MASLATSALHWNGVWDESAITKAGEGIVCEGTLVGLRFHTVTTKNDIVRYQVLIVDVKHAHKRQFSKFGEEIYPDFENAKSPNALSFDQMQKLLGGGGKFAVPEKWLEDSKLFQALHPNVKGRFEFWVNPDIFKKVNLKVKDPVLVHTRGFCVICQQVGNQNVSQFHDVAGGEVLDQVSKLSNVYGAQHGKGPLRQDQNEGVDPSEWDD